MIFYSVTKLVSFAVRNFAGEDTDPVCHRTGEQKNQLSVLLQLNVSSKDLSLEVVDTLSELPGSCGPSPGPSATRKRPDWICAPSPDSNSSQDHKLPQSQKPEWSVDSNQYMISCDGSAVHSSSGISSTRSIFNTGLSKIFEVSAFRHSVCVIHSDHNSFHRIQMVGANSQPS